MKFTPISGIRVRIRDFNEKDLPEFARYRALPEIARYQSWDSFTLEDARRLHSAQFGTPFATPGTWHQVAIADVASDALIGDCALHFPEDERQMEIGFTLAPEHQGKGLAREAVGLLLDYAFGAMKLGRVLAKTDADNLPAQRLLEALDFRKQAVRDVLFKGKKGKEFDFICTSGSRA